MLLNKIARLCRQHQVKLLFLYTPSFAYFDFPPKELETYQKYGAVWLPPASIFNNKNYWVDDVHLNEAGGKACSEWFAKKFEKIIQMD